MAQDVGGGVEGVGVLIGRADQHGIQAGRAQRGSGVTGEVVVGGELLVQGGLELAQRRHAPWGAQAAQGAGHHAGGRFHPVGELVDRLHHLGRLDRLDLALLRVGGFQRRVQSE